MITPDLSPYIPLEERARRKSQKPLNEETDNKSEEKTQKIDSIEGMKVGQINKQRPLVHGGLLTAKKTQIHYSMSLLLLQTSLSIFPFKFPFCLFSLTAHNTRISCTHIVIAHQEGQSGQHLQLPLAQQRLGGGLCRRRVQCTRRYGQSDGIAGTPVAHAAYQHSEHCQPRLWGLLPQPQHQRQDLHSYGSEWDDVRSRTSYYAAFLHHGEGHGGECEYHTSLPYISNVA